MQIVLPPQVFAGIGNNGQTPPGTGKMALNLLYQAWPNPDLRDKAHNMNVEMTASSSPKILVVDDNLVIQRTVAMALTKAGYQVSIAGDISDALSAARREKPNLILLDISFPLDSANVGGPSQDGLFVIQWLDRTPETKIIPIIIISGTDPAKYKDQISASGIVAWFRKPLNHEELLATIKTVLANKTASLQPVSPEI